MGGRFSRSIHSIHDRHFRLPMDNPLLSRIEQGSVSATRKPPKENTAAGRRRNANDFITVFTRFVETRKSFFPSPSLPYHQIDGVVKYSILISAVLIPHTTQSSLYLDIPFAILGNFFLLDDQIIPC